jgi:hypothetical protein
VTFLAIEVGHVTFVKQHPVAVDGKPDFASTASMVPQAGFVARCHAVVLGIASLSPAAVGIQIGAIGAVTRAGATIVRALVAAATGFRRTADAVVAAATVGVTVSSIFSAGSTNAVTTFATIRVTAALVFIVVNVAVTIAAGANAVSVAAPRISAIFAAAGVKQGPLLIIGPTTLVTADAWTTIFVAIAI